MSLVNLASWEEQGYVVIPNAVSPEDCAATVAAIWDFMGKSPERQEEWYQPPLERSGMVNMTQHFTLWNNRQTPCVHQAFAEIWGTPALWVTINRANLNPPITTDWDREELLHWDYQVEKRGLRPAMQGVLSLTDTTEEMGGFHCVPGSHRRLAEWHKKHPEGEAPTVEDIANKSEVVPIESQAGDLIIWHQGLIHGNGRNISQKPRFAQYICMTPAGTSRQPSGLQPVPDGTQAQRVEAWLLGGYMKEISSVLGVPEALVEGWLAGAIKKAAHLQEIPQPKQSSLLTPEQILGLPTLLEHKNVWQRPDGTPVKTGSAVWNLDASRLCQRIGEIIAEEYALTVAPEPAPLTPLGRKLLGMDSWETGGEA